MSYDVIKSQRRPLFVTERGGPFTTDAVNRLVKRLGDGEKLFGFPIHIHMLRHSCGYALANAGHDTRAIQDYLGHKAIQHTVRYTELTQGFLAQDLSPT